MDPIIGGALINTAANIGSNLISNSGSKRSQARADKYNRNMWHMQNAYNTPQAQRERLAEANLNPNLVYGSGISGAAGMADSPPQSKAAKFDFPSPVQDINSFANLGRTGAQTDNLKAQNTVLTQEALLKAGQTADLAIKTAKTKFDLGLATELRQTSLEAAKANLRSVEQGTIQKQLDNTVKSKAQQDLIKEIFYKAQNAKEELKGNQLLNELRGLERDLKKIGIERNDPWYFRIFGRQLGEDGLNEIFNNKK